MSIQSLGYIWLETADIGGWRTLATDLLGLMPVASDDPSTQTYRIDHYPQRLHLREGPVSRPEAIGWEVRDRRDLLELVAKIEDAGHTVAMGTPEEAAERHVSGLARMVDPSGLPIEFFFGPILDHTRVQTPLVSGFNTGDQGMGHVVVLVPDASETYAFYTELLGFRVRNTMVIPGGWDMWFLSTNGRHHSMAMIEIPGDARIAHFMVQAQTIDDVGCALDRVMAAEWPIQMTLGRHTNDHMISFYAESPDGLAVEMGYGGLTISQPETTYAITKGSFWGHHMAGPPGPV